MDESLCTDGTGWAEMLATDCATHLGGEDSDQNVMQRLIATVLRERNGEFSTPLPQTMTRTPS